MAAKTKNNSSNLEENNDIKIFVENRETPENSAPKESPAHPFADEPAPDSQTIHQPPRKKKRRILKIFVFILVFFTIFSFIFFKSISQTDNSVISWIQKIPIFKSIKNLAISSDKKLKGEDRDRINVLLLGIGGKGHDGAYLTDTIMLGSLEPSTQKIALISIPRDMAVPIENYGWRKINSVNAYAESANPGTGSIAISQALSDILNLPIDYYIRVDFEGFVNIINEIGGIDVDVENTLDDYSYPVQGMEDAPVYSSRYEHLHIDKGPQHMDGEMALKYARSRHGLGAEGSDFARSKRQQKVLEAAKEKLLSKKILLNPTKLSNIIGQLNEHIDTNLKIWEILKFWDLFKDTPKENIENKVIDNSPNGLLYDSMTADGAYILSPRSGDFSEIQYFVNNIFIKPSASSAEKNPIIEDEATAEVRNGTWVNGLANRVAMDLEKMGFEIIGIGNSSKKDFQKTVIYDLSNGEKSQALEALRQKLDANISLSLPEWLISDIKKDLENTANPVQPDFIIILGQNADPTSSGSVNVE